MKDGQLCFEIKGDQDCWRYTGSFELDRPMTMTMSAAGQVPMTAIYTLRPGTSGRMPSAVKP